MTKKIALTGAHGTGKTTLIQALTQRLTERYRVEACSEVPRILIDAAGDNTLFQRGNNTFIRQTTIMAGQFEEESRLLKLGPDLLLCDRTIIDHWAYTETLFPSECDALEGRLWKTIVIRWLATYDLILKLPIEFSIIADGVREDDVSFQRDIDEIIDHLYREAKVDVEVIRGSVNERCSKIESLIERLR